MTQKPVPSPGKVFARLALFVVVGMPLVAYLWETLHLLLALQVEPVRLLISVPVLGLFVGLLVLLARTLDG